MCKRFPHRIQLPVRAGGDAPVVRLSSVNTTFENEQEEVGDMASRAQQQPQGLSQVSRRAMGMDGGSKQAGQGVYLCASLYREELVDLRERGAGAASVSFGFPRTRSPARPFARWRHRLLFYTY
jgi:hypothetical protein